MSGRIVAEYKDYSLWESELSEAVPVNIGGHNYYITQSHATVTKTYEEALLEPEWEIFS